jgi:hypothetical protein
MSFGGAMGAFRAYDTFKGNSGGGMEVRNQSWLQRLFDVVLCRQRRGGGGGGGGGGGSGKKKRPTMQRKTGDDYDPYERIEVSVTDNIMWTWNWLMKNESMVGSDGHRSDIRRTYRSLQRVIHLIAL